MSAASQRGRPRGFDRQATLDKALEVFWDRGYAGTTTRDLESSLGVSQSSLYNTFGSKSELFDLAVERYEHMIDRELLGALERADDGFAALDRFFGQLLDWITTAGHHGCMLMNLFAEEGGGDPAIRDHSARYRARLRTAFAHALVAGGVDPTGVGSKADLLVVSVLGLNLAARCEAPTGELDRMLAATRTLVASWAQPTE